MQSNLTEHITPHFTWRELLTSPTAVRLGIDNTPDSDAIYANIRRVAAALELIHEYYERMNLATVVLIHVNSCFRSAAVNKAVGGSATSAHRFGSAADFTVQGIANIDVCRAIPLIVPEFDQVIYEFGPSGWVHLGLAKTPRQQLLTAIKEKGKTIYKPGIIPV